LSTPVLAQSPGGPGSGPSKHNRIDFLATILNLSDDQKQQATAIFDAAKQASAPLYSSLKQQHQELNNASKAAAADSQIDQLSASIGDLTGQLTAIRTKAFARFYAILHTDQQMKLDQLEASGRGLMGHGFGPGGPLP
jgi:Spy/CpxP family protein refolding chaperone